MESDTAERVTIEQEKSGQDTSQQNNNAEQKSAETWAHIVRGLYVLLFWFILRISEFVVAGVAILTFGFKMATGKPQPKVREFGDSLSTYVYQVVSFMTYKTDTKPFPFQEWPAPEQSAEPSTTREESEVEVVEVVEVVAEGDEGRRGKSEESSVETVQPPPGKDPGETRPSA